MWVATVSAVVVVVMLMAATVWTPVLAVVVVWVPLTRATATVRQSIGASFSTATAATMTTWADRLNRCTIATGHTAEAVPGP